jgi:hypothetical protein
LSRVCITLLTLTLIAWASEPMLSSGPEDDPPPDVGMRAAGSEIDITWPRSALEVSHQDLLEWIHSAADAVTHYYGRFPVPHLFLQIRAARGDEIGHGVTYPRFGGLIKVDVGRGAQAGDLQDDWVLTHEMLHLAYPTMSGNQHWIEEGIASYVEPVARAQVGNLSAAAVWRQFILNMPKGEPAPGDQGLDRTPTWGRTYWGGAMFCLLADVQIRERTENRKGLRDALRAILDGGGVVDQDWSIDKAFSIGDRATGTRVLQRLYSQMRDKADPVDLDQLWRKLGVSLKDGEVVYNNQAPDAAIRKALTSP